jgi:hypothetical protein
MPKAEQDKWLAEYGACTEGLKRSGHYVGGERLESTATATVVRQRNGKVAITDGPFVETKEQLGGFYMITAEDLDEAIQLASTIPGARHGSIEVRPVMELRQP